MQLIKITKNLRPRYQAAVEALEALASYPLGNDHFQIKHGADYFAFFDRLGEVHYFAMLDEGQVVAVACGVIRPLPWRAWYLCDLKVHPDFRGKHLPLRMLARALPTHYLRCRRGYAISMNSPQLTGNRVANLLARFPWLTLRAVATLELFSLSDQVMHEVADVVGSHRGPLSYLSLHGVKDLILASSQCPLPIAHVQFGPNAAAGSPLPTPGALHMFCSPEGDPLNRALRQRGVEPTATATVIAHRLPQADWRFILTSDI